LSFHKI